MIKLKRHHIFKDMQNEMTDLDQLQNDYFACNASSPRKVTPPSTADSEDIQRVTIECTKKQLDVNGCSSHSFHLMKNNILIGLLSNYSRRHECHLVVYGKSVMLYTVSLEVSPLHLIVNREDSLCVVCGKKALNDDCILLVFRINDKNPNKPPLSFITEHAVRSDCSFHPSPWNDSVVTAALAGSVLIIGTTWHMQKLKIEDQIILSNDICLMRKMPLLYHVFGVALDDSLNAVLVTRSCQLVDVNFKTDRVAQIYEGHNFCWHSAVPSCMVSLSKVSMPYSGLEIYFVVCHYECMFYTFARDENHNLHLARKIPMSEILNADHDTGYFIMDSNLAPTTGYCYVLFRDVDHFCNKILGFNVINPKQNRLLLLDPLNSPRVTSLHINWWREEALCIDEDGRVRAYLLPIRSLTLKHFAKQTIRRYFSKPNITRLDIPRSLRLYLTL